MVMPLYDIDPLEGKSTPYVTYGLIALNLFVAICVDTQPDQETFNSIINVLGLIPAVETLRTAGHWVGSARFSTFHFDVSAC